MTRRSLFVGLCALALVAGACSSPPTNGSGAPPSTGGGNGKPSLPTCPLAALKKATGPVDVKLWYGGLGGDTQETMQSLAKDFNALPAAKKGGANVKVAANNRGTSYAEVLKAYESASSGNKKQLPGIVYLEDNALLSMVNSGQVLPAQSCMVADKYDMTDILPAVRAAFTVHDTLWPGYVNVSAPVLYFNKVHFLKAGLDPNNPPKTLDEVYEAAKKIKAAGIAPTPFAFKRSAWFFTQWVNGAGGNVISGANGRDLADGEVPKATFDNPQGKAVLAWLKKMKDAGLMVDFEAEGGPTGIDHYLSLLPDGSGKTKASMLLETSTAATTIKSVLNGKITGKDAGIQFDASVIDKSALVPGTAAYPGEKKAGQVATGGGAFYILNTSTPAVQAGSWEFLKYMLQPENVYKWHSVGGYLPTTKSMQDLPQVAKFWTDDLAGVLLQPGTQELATADPDRPAPLIGPYQDYANAVQAMLDKVLLSNAPVDASLATAQKSVDTALQRYGG